MAPAAVEGHRLQRHPLHPSSDVLLDVCDRIVLLVMDKNRHFNPSTYYLAQLRWLVRRDCNRPCVIMWLEWGLTHGESWKMIASRPFVAGTFVWTGFDYHGEPTPLPWPAASSSFGILDLCGFAKMAYHLRRAQWIADQPFLAIGPPCNWPGREVARTLVETTGRPVRPRLTADRALTAGTGRDVQPISADVLDDARRHVPTATDRITFTLNGAT